MVSSTLKRLTAVSLAAALAFTLAACGKGGSTSSDSTNSNGAATLKLWTHNAGNEKELDRIEFGGQAVESARVSRPEERIWDRHDVGSPMNTNSTQ